MSSPLGCSQCGRELPADADELRRWEQGSLVLAGEVDDVTAAMLLCPDCAEEDRAGEYEEGEAG
jgi:hypothetical protein